uniref:HTH luxR-type domain-containing protein n=1 Tax=Caenorhabditis japonica TaxID=281687 RepID=A0A8R1IKS3_CAEJA
MKSSPHRPSIELLFKRGLGSAEIARRLQISSSTVRNVVAAIKKRGDASEVKKSGRPRSVNTRNTRAIIKKRIIRNDGLSLNRMASQLGIARSTVQSIVKNDLKLKSYKLRRGQYLSDKSKAMRLEKCRKLLQHFQVRRVSDVIWTDEKIFTIEPLPNRQNQRQLLSKDDSMSPKRRLAHNRLFPKSVMVWAGITATGKTPLVFIERNVKINSEVYQKIVLMDNLLPWVTQHFAGGPFILQQDWAPSHGSRSTLAVLEAHFPGFLDKNLWPASSPDLNPMDFSVWGMLEGKIAGKVFATVDDLKAALEVAWASIDDGYLRRTVNSVKKQTIGANFGQWQLHGPYGELVKQAGQHATTTTCHLLRKVILRWRECQKRRTWPLVKAGDVNDVLCSPVGNLIYDPLDICCGIQKTFQSLFYFVH